MVSSGAKLGLILLIFEVVCLALFAFFSDYEDSANASHPSNSKDHSVLGGADPDHNPIAKYYPMFQDVHVMIFIGFGFLMTFLKKYGFSSVGLNMLLAAVSIQWAMIFGGLLHNKGGIAHIGIENMITSDFAAGAVLISFGAVLGKLSPPQIVIMAIIEIVFFSINEYIGLEIFHVADVGGSMFVHTFGAYFGLALSKVVYKRGVKDSEDEGSSYHGDLFAMIGTVFLWMYWPSFNSALATGDDQHRAVLNTYLSLAASCVVTFAISALVSHDTKLDMVHIQNATLAGGVAIGTSADMMVKPWGAILVGCIAGLVSTLGYRYLQPRLLKALTLHDTCGVNNLHGMPGIIGGSVGAIVSAFATVETYGYSMYEIFPARAPTANNTMLAEINVHLAGVEAGTERTATTQMLYQFMALGVTLLFALIGGACTGLVLRLPFFSQPDKSSAFHDEEWWETPEDYSLTGSSARHEKIVHTSTEQMSITTGANGFNANTEI